jgi:hypothetical protein
MSQRNVCKRGAFTLGRLNFFGNELEPLEVVISNCGIIHIPTILVSKLAYARHTVEGNWNRYLKM